MKIVLRGARRSGKTTLLKRLQGLKFDSEYDPTKEIKTTHVEWNYRASDEMIKVRSRSRRDEVKHTPPNV